MTVKIIRDLFRMLIDSIAFYAISGKICGINAANWVLLIFQFHTLLACIVKSYERDIFNLSTTLHLCTETCTVS